VGCDELHQCRCIVYPTKKAFHVWRAFLVETTKQNLNKNYAGTKIVFLLLIGRKTKK